MSYALWIVQWLLGLFFILGSGAPKLLLSAETLPMPIPLPGWFVLIRRGSSRLVNGSGSSHARPHTQVVQGSPVMCLGGAAHASVDQAVITRAFGDQVPAPHPLVGALKLLRWIRSWLYIPQPGKMKVLGREQSLLRRG